MRTRIVLFLLLLPAAARADGMVTYHTEVGDAASVTVEAETQRAVLWWHDEAWEITIQPRFPRGKGAAAWIVPFPVVPDVFPASADFLDALETLTAPVFIPYCREEEDHGGGGIFGCGGAATGGGVEPGRTGTGEQGVVIWAAGATDTLDWVVLEAPGADALLAWLDAEGYAVPAFISDAPELLDGQVVFAARLLEDLDPAAPLPPMSFRLPGVEYGDVTYPLRLTAAVAPEDGMELLLWVVAPPGKDPLFPAPQRWLPHTGPADSTREQWEADVETIRAAFPPEGGLVLEYGGVPGAGDLYLRYPLHPPGGWEDVNLPDAGIDLPDEWPSEVSVIGEGGARVLRFRGALRAAAMTEDLGFVPDPGAVTELDAIHWRKVPCAEIGPDADVVASAGRGPQAGAALTVLALLGGLLVLRRLS